MGKANDPKFFYGWLVLLGCFLISFNYGFFYSYGVFFAELQEEFGWGRALTSTLPAVSTVVYCIAAVVIGWLTDKIGPRRVIIGCSILVGVGLALSSQAHTLWQMYLFWGGLLAIGFGVAYSLPAATVQRWFVKRRGLVLGIYMSGIGAGTLILSLLCTHLIIAYGWRITFLISGVIAFVVMFIPAFLIYRTPEEKGLKPYGVEASPVAEASKQAEPASTEVGWTLKEALKTRAMWTAWGIHVLASIPLLIVMVHIVPHCMDMGISQMAAAGALGIISAVAIGGRLFMGAIADKIGFNRCVGISLALCAAMMLFLIPIKSVGMIYLFAVIYGIGYGGKSATLPGLVGHLMGMKSLPVLIGVLATAWGVAGAIGPPIAGYIWDTTHSYTIAFAIGAGLYVIGSILGFTVKPPKKTPSPQIPTPASS